ncbi:SDR family oxidoreductase [Comamonadaceae bacterium G21597-S1]|nr:SDR family oxidoreductase [Comamonadaceae bacterium G21597-S1]
MTRNVKQLFDLAGKTALVTGGSRGLGLQIAEALGEWGASVIVSSRKAAELAEAVEHLRGRGITADWIAADNAKDADMAALADEAIKRLGHIDILVNNAGATWGAPMEEHPIPAWDKVMGVNIRGLFVLTQLIGKQSMLPRKSGRVINVASIAGLGGNPDFMKTIAYNSSKGACITFTRALACEWGPRGITVNAIAPGSFATKMTVHMFANGGGDTLASNVPLRRTGDAEDIKGLVSLLASDAGKHITGQVIAVDGGVSAVIAA